MEFLLYFHETFVICTAPYIYFFGKRGWLSVMNPPLAPSVFWISFIWFEDQISQTGQEFCLQNGAKCLQRARLWRNVMGLNLLVMCRMSCYCSRGKLWFGLKELFNVSQLSTLLLFAVLVKLWATKYGTQKLRTS